MSQVPTSSMPVTSGQVLLECDLHFRRYVANGFDDIATVEVFDGSAVGQSRTAACPDRIGSQLQRSTIKLAV